MIDAQDNKAADRAHQPTPLPITRSPVVPASWQVSLRRVHRLAWAAGDVQSFGHGPDEVIVSRVAHRPESRCAVA